MKISNNKAIEYIKKLEVFQGNNTYAEWLSHGSGDDSGHHESKKIYVIYSYGHHFPIYIYDAKEQKWIGNKDKYSPSTTRHQSLLRPSDEDIIWLSSDEMQKVRFNYGLVGYLINQAQN